jgi:hypothetical protein
MKCKRSWCPTCPFEDEHAVFCPPLEEATEQASAAELFVRHAWEGVLASVVVLVIFGGLALAFWR